MDPVWIAIAFALGLAVRMIGLPPLVGFLGAGFALRAFGAEAGPALEQVADLGVYLLLFGIGLKLQVRSLMRPEIWGVATIHMALTTIAFAAGLFLVGLAGVGLVGGIRFPVALLIAFALSFSSTVFAVKLLEESGESNALHGRIAIGILIVQDIFAILFLTISMGKVPTVGALWLLALPLVRPVLLAIMTRSGHGELLVLFGVVLVFAATGFFSAVQIKPDLGALVAGVVVGSHPKANELSKALMGFKDLFLVGFFLSIGLEGLPSAEIVATAVVLAAVMPLKVVLFFLLMTRFRLRIRTSLLGSISLANYSEFGLIVGAVGAQSGWIPDDWLLVVALALTITFVAAAPLAARGTLVYEYLGERLRRFESPRRIPSDEVVDPGGARVAIFGMGRIGAGAYDEIRSRLGDVVIGIDREPASVQRHTDQGRRVVLGDATDSDFYSRIPRNAARPDVIMLAMSSQAEKLAATRLLTRQGYPGLIAATVQFPDQIHELRQAGARAAFDIFADAGIGLADQVCEGLQRSTQPGAQAGPSAAPS